MREHEAKLSVEPDFEVPDLDARLAESGVEVLAPKTRTITDVYYDTADLRLLRWGCTLRHRKRSGWTVKLPISSDDESLTRDEINLGGRAGRPTAEALKLVASFSRGEPLDVVARVTTQRTIRPIHSTDGRLLVELADDVVTSETSDGRTTTFRQVEVELAPQAEPSILGPILEALTDAGAQPQPGGIKLALALGQPPLEPEIAVPRLPNHPSARDVIHRAIARSVERLIVQLPIARCGQDPEGVHQARVATRRLRSDLRTFQPLLDPDWVAQLSPRLRDLADHLGQVRDADVLYDLLHMTLVSRPEIDQLSGEEVLALLSSQRQEALAALDAYLDRPETHQLLEHLIAAAGDPPTTPDADGPAKRQLSGLVIKRWRRLNRTVGDLDRHPPPEALHEVRILAKRMRYAIEAVAPAFGPKTRRLAKSLAAVQETIGDLNDASTANRWLTQNAADLSTLAAFAAGRLTQTLHDTASTHDQWRATWKKIKGRQPAWLRP